MRTIRIYSPNKLLSNSLVELEGNAARHISQVLRMLAGDHIVLFDGDGQEHSGSIETAGKNQVTVQLQSVTSPPTESTLHITLWHGLCRSGRMDNVVQKATELGVAAIQPIVSEFSVVKLDSNRASKKTSHWQQVAISACEQSGRVRVPQIHEPRKLSSCLEQLAHNPDKTHVRLMLDPEGTQGLAQHLQKDLPTIVLIGPEGGFSSAEKAAGLDAGFKLIALGPRVLRTETAPVVALGLLQHLAGDLS